MPSSEVGQGEPVEVASGAETKAARRRAKLEIERAAILDAVRSFQPTTLTQRVALLLNQFPETRNSDVALQLRYWRAYHDYHGGAINPDDLFRWVRLTSVARSRARIQNEHRLFEAEPEIQKQRRRLSEDQLREAREGKHQSSESYTVFLDESGKNDPVVLVGGLWCMDGMATIRLVNGLQTLRRGAGKGVELHFKEVREDTLAYFMTAVDMALEATTFSFKYMGVERRGLNDVDWAIERMMYHLVVEGIAHEHESGRAPLPRLVNVVKDADKPGKDKVLCAEIADRLRAISAPRFKSMLEVGTVQPESSNRHPLLQITDLLVASVRRVRSRTRAASGHSKDILADHVVARVGVAAHNRVADFGDLAVEIRL